MKHEDYQFMINLALDGDLGEDEKQDLNHHLEGCATCSQMWQRMQQMEALFTRPPEAVPPADFTARVMARIERQQSRRVTPAVAVMLAVSSLVAALTIALPVMFLAIGLEGITAAVPGLSLFFEQLTGFYHQIAGQVSLVVNGFIEVLSLVVTNPFMLTTALLALTIASIWIGVLESMKFNRMAISQRA